MPIWRNTGGDVWTRNSVPLHSVLPINGCDSSISFVSFIFPLKVVLEHTETVICCGLFFYSDAQACLIKRPKCSGMNKLQPKGKWPGLGANYEC